MRTELAEDAVLESPSSISLHAYPGTTAHGAARSCHSPGPRDHDGPMPSAAVNIVSLLARWHFTACTRLQQALWGKRRGCYCSVLAFGFLFCCFGT